MLCYMLRGRHKKIAADRQGTEHDTADWVGRRALEILGFHSTEKRISILCLACLENCLADGVENELHVMHPGDVEFELLNPWPLPFHPDVNDRSDDHNILKHIYGEAFEEDAQGSICQKQMLSAWDSWYDVKDEPVAVWPPKADFDPEEFVCIPEGLRQRPAPFTVRSLGPFTRHGITLIAFKLTATGRSYDQLIEKPYFPIDGPKSLLVRTECDYVSALEPAQRQPWLEELRRFETYIDAGESYDVIILNEPYADQVQRLYQRSIVMAPIQPPNNIAQRYITRNPNFSLLMEYTRISAGQRLVADVKC